VVKIVQRTRRDALLPNYEKQDLREHTEELNRLRDLENKYNEQLIQNEILKQF